MNEWAKTVQMVYNKNKHRPGYKLKDAMRDAKKVYKPKTKKLIYKNKHGQIKYTKHKYGGGDGDSDSDSDSDSGSEPEMVEETETEEVMEGGRRHRRTRRRHRGGRRTRRRTRRHRRH